MLLAYMLLYTLLYTLLYRRVYSLPYTIVVIWGKVVTFDVGELQWRGELGGDYPD